MTIYKLSERFAKQVDKGFAGVIFDCDGVLIDASRSYDLALELSAMAFSSLLGFKPNDKELSNAVEELRRLGTFNNDWDTLAVIVAYAYSKSQDRGSLEQIASRDPLSSRLRDFEAKSSHLMRSGQGKSLDLENLLALVRNSPIGTKRDELIERILSNDKSLLEKYYKSVSYPLPVGESLLGTFFDEAMYGQQVFRATYGFDCATKSVSKPGFITQEKTIASDNTFSMLSELSRGNLGIITGRPKVPTVHTLGDAFHRWFTNSRICLFTGDYLLNTEEVKPSPKPMLKVATALNDKKAPILYVGDAGEDALMTKAANERDLLNGRVYFAAIAPSRQKADYFEREGDGVDCIATDVNEIARAISSGAIWEQTRKVS